MIALVKKNCSITSSIRLHTFGVGSGADEKLIKGCAIAGIGSFSFIYKTSEVESKVIESLAKSKLSYILVTKACIYGPSGEVIEQMLNLPYALESTSLFRFSSLLVNKPKASSYEV